MWRIHRSNNLSTICWAAGHGHEAMELISAVVSCGDDFSELRMSGFGIIDSE